MPGALRLAFISELSSDLNCRPDPFRDVLCRLSYNSQGKLQMESYRSLHRGKPALITKLNYRAIYGRGRRT